ncbi:hypothetical protein ND748_31215, partial [Frankia sp. AiPs1]|uniref:flavodoxin domain-containing protein n=1 Tax=Frankia sp. AiPs1 TaxID=573493 RepID=UPI00255B2A6D
MTRALVAFGTGCGGVGDLAAMIGAALTARGLDADVLPARQVREVASYDAVIVAGALFAGRWACDARRLVRRRRAGLSRLPVWLVSSDLRAAALVAQVAQVAQVVEPAQVAELATLIGARGMVTFDGPQGAAAGTGAGHLSAAATRATVGNRRRPE